MNHRLLKICVSAQESTCDQRSHRALHFWSMIARPETIRFRQLMIDEKDDTVTKASFERNLPGLCFFSFMLAIICFLRTEELYLLPVGITTPVLFALSLWAVLLAIFREKRLPEEQAFWAAASMSVTADLCAFAFWKTCQVLLIDCVLFVLFTVIRFFYFVAKKIYILREKDALKRQCFSICSRVVGVAVIILLLLTASFLEFYEKTYALPHLFSMRETQAVVEVETEPHIEADNMCEIALVQKVQAFAEKWDTLTFGEKDLAVRLTIRAEYMHLGLQGNQPAVVYKNTPDDKYGCYSYLQHTIYIDRHHLEEDPARFVFRSVIHEMHHVYVMQTVHLFDFEAEPLQNNYYFEKLRAWKTNIDNYIDVSEDFEQYWQQPIEADAYEYANDRVPAYLSAES